MSMERTEEIRQKFLRNEHTLTLWINKAKLVYEFHQRMQDVRGPGHKRTGVGWSIRKTAEALGLPKATAYLNYRAGMKLTEIQYATDLTLYRNLNEFCVHYDLVRK